MLFRSVSLLRNEAIGRSGSYSVAATAPSRCSLCFASVTDCIRPSIISSSSLTRCSIAWKVWEVYPDISRLECRGIYLSARLLLHCQTIAFFMSACLVSGNFSATWTACLPRLLGCVECLGIKASGSRMLLFTGKERSGNPLLGDESTRTGKDAPASGHGNGHAVTVEGNYLHPTLQINHVSRRSKSIGRRGWIP